MSSQPRQSANGKRGESRTEALLLDRFWVLKRSEDVEGADFLIQLPGSLEELKARKFRIEVLGIVQAKYFEKNNQVKIARQYVEDSSGRAWGEFFALLHTTSENGEDSCYFFTAREIQRDFYLSQDGKHYCFSITKERDYGANCNIEKSAILDIIAAEMEKAEFTRNAEFIKIVYIEVPPGSMQVEGQVPTIRQTGAVVEATIYHPSTDTT